ncbi:MAG: CehA/McbA family metallohydrolase, partial [Aureliella sp.]
MRVFAQLVLIFGLFSACTVSVTAEDGSLVEIENAMVHLRRDGAPEWTTFEKEADGESLVRRFNAHSNSKAWTLSVRQQDVKESWEVVLNGNTLGRLTLDENDLRSDFLVPQNAVNDGTNILEVRQTPSGEIDDIRVGEIRLHPVDPRTLRNAAQLEIVLVGNIDTPMPGRITIVDENGTLLPVGAVSVDGLAVRTGVVYTATGTAKFGVSDGRIRVYGGRGLEYSVADALIDVKAGDKLNLVLVIKRELDTRGWIACDTHVHTATFSGHGDCTIDERMVTLAGEGIESAIATDHNQHIDYRPNALTAGVETRFTSVIGNEVTTKHAHVCIFPVAEGSAIPDPSQADWGLLFENLFATPNVRVAILNHARDIHSGFRPFSPRHHISFTGENLDGQEMPFNAMEVINSGATQTEPKQLFYDWCGLINRGLKVTPVGSSDSHDVSRFIVGQGRTYIQCDDSDIANIEVAAAMDALVSGRVVVSYALFPALRIETASDSSDHGAGEL